jgi:uncharacterized protein (TIGR03086 family)
MSEAGLRSVDRHRLACDGFAEQASSVGDRWNNASPCSEWNARDVFEHVIGFHEVLVLRPLGVKVNRPKGDVPGRWDATQAAVFKALEATSNQPVDLPEGSTLDVSNLLPMLTIDVLVHTWDIAKAIGDQPELDSELCQWALDVSRGHEDALRSSGMYNQAVVVATNSDAPDQLVALLGRDPYWRSGP